MGRLHTWLYRLDSTSECGYSTCCAGSDNAIFRVVFNIDKLIKKKIKLPKYNLPGTWTNRLTHCRRTNNYSLI